MHGRASVRKYAPEPVPRADVEAMVALAIRAANAGNAQSWRFIAVEDTELRIEPKEKALGTPATKVGEKTGSFFAGSAPNPDEDCHSCGLPLLRHNPSVAGSAP